MLPSDSKLLPDTPISSILEVLEYDFLRVYPTSLVRDIASLMYKHQAGYVVITRDKTNGISNRTVTPLGIVTREDILRIQVEGLDINCMQAQAVMSTPLFCLRTSDNLHRAYQEMQRLKISHGIVLDKHDQLQGVITTQSLLRSINTKLVDKLEQQLHHLQIEKQTLLSRGNLQLEQQVQQRTAKLKEQSEYNRLLANLTGDIRKSLNLQEVLDTTVEKIRQFLKTDRVFICRFNTKGDGVVVAESVGENWPSLLGNILPQSCFETTWIENYYQKITRQITNIYEASLSQSKIKLLEQWQTKAKLTVPILLDFKLWGLVCAHHCTSTREWSSNSANLLLNLAFQVGKAIQQSELYQHSQWELKEYQREKKALKEREQRLCKHNQVLMSLAKNKLISSGNIAASLRKIIEVAAQTLEVDQVGFWLCRESYSAISCYDLFCLRSKEHSAGIKINLAQQSRYLQALENERIITVRNTLEDERTQEFLEAYFIPYQVTSVLDAPVYLDGKLIGVICHEQLVNSRQWTVEEQNFAGSIAEFISLAFEAVKRRTAQVEIIRLNEELEQRVIKRTEALEVLNQELGEARRQLERRVETRTEQLEKVNQNLRQEIAERQQVEASLRASEERYATLANILEITNEELEKRVAQRTAELRQVMAELQEEIIERKQAETKITASLKEKEVLLKEIHHRVKNNLQIISSLLKLQSSYVKDEKVLGLFEESNNRVKTMALIHEKLYQSPNLARINAQEYINNLTNNLVHSYSVFNHNIKLCLDIDNIFLDIDTAIPCGLIINELVSNSLKYAFIEKDDGLVLLKLSLNKSQGITLLVKDNGVGLQEDLKIEEVDSLGLQLVYNLTEQLEGKIKIERGQGTYFEINFPYPKHQEEVK